MMREQTSPRFRSQPGLLPGMLKRTKYSRLRNDSLTSLDDCPQRIKRELHLDSDFVQPDPGTSSDQGPSTLRDFIPRMANIRLHSPISLQSLRGQRTSAEDRTTDGPVSGSQWTPGPSQRPRSRGELLPHSALCRTQRPLTLHTITSLSWTPWTHTALSSETWTGTRAVHHDIKVNDLSESDLSLSPDEYMGSVEVTRSMRTLNFDARMQVTREAISKLCEKTSAKTTVRTKRPAHKAVSDVLGQINLQFSGSSVVLSVSTDSLTLVSSSSLQRITHHHMQSISFASGGDPDMSDYIAYVAKDVSSQRACYILECPRGRACDVINTIGRAFETRFRELLCLTPSLICRRSALRVCPDWSPEETTFDLRAKQEVKVSEHCDYYNVTPGKTSPAGGAEDLHVGRADGDTQEVWFPRPVALYENCSLTDDSAAPPAVMSEVSEQCPHLSDPLIQDLIQDEGWFHGRLGREEAESLLTCSGDFLVRESSSASGQYVLSGMEGATVQHLLLVDPHGQVRTRDQVFVSIGHLVRFHMENQAPIISGNGELHLKQPILQSH